MMNPYRRVATIHTHLFHSLLPRMGMESSVNVVAQSSRLQMQQVAHQHSSAQHTIQSPFAHVQVAPPDEVFFTGIRYRADPSAHKVDLGVGAYRTNEGKPYVLNVVRKAEDIIHQDKKLDKEYLAIDGFNPFVKAAREMIFGRDSPALIGDRVATAQAISGTGSLRVGFDFIAKFFPKNTSLYISNPSWAVHTQMCEAAHVPFKRYRYWDAKHRKLEMNGLLEDLQNAPNKSVILLHACAHNPTGVDPTHEEWKQIANLIREKEHIPFFDCAYQGFASGNLDNDAWAIRYFVKEGFYLFVAQSFAKNFGLYNDRVGTMSLVTASSKEMEAVLSQMKMIIRPNYSNPPAHGARIVSIVLGHPELTAQWKDELNIMSGRIIEMRRALRSALEALKTPGDWSHITTQIGMFSFTGLTKNQCAALTDQYHIYLLSNGRISMAGLNTNNVQYVAKAIHEVVTSIRD